MPTRARDLVVLTAFGAWWSSGACGSPRPEPTAAPRPGTTPAVRDAPEEVPPAIDDMEASAKTPTSVRIAEPPSGYLGFGAGCTDAPMAVVAAAGDFIPHRELQRHAYEQSRRFRAIWEAVEPSLSRADVTVLNLEAPAAPGITRELAVVDDPGYVYDRRVYSGYPRFNMHPRIAKDLRRAGVDLVSTANNHALDRGPLGVDRTIDSLDAVGLRHTGTRHHDRMDASWSVRTRAADVRVAWLACTEHTNRRPDPDRQVLRCDRDARFIRQEITRLRDRRDVDAVIVLPHWGEQYEPEPTPQQRAWARDWIDAGADAVLGNHPHVLQGWERVEASDGREAFVMYSLGNFASHQPELPRRTSMILYLGFAKTETGTRVAGVRYLPTHVREVDRRFRVEPLTPDDADAWAQVVGRFGEGNLVETSPSEGVSFCWTAPSEDPV